MTLLMWRNISNNIQITLPVSGFLTYTFLVVSKDYEAEERPIWLKCLDNVCKIFTSTTHTQTVAIIHSTRLYNRYNKTYVVQWNKLNQFTLALPGTDDATREFLLTWFNFNHIMHK